MIDQTSLAAIRQRALDEMVRLTGSTVGFHATVSPDDLSITLDHVSTSGPTALAQPHLAVESLAQASCWRECVGRREPVIHNRLPGESAPGAAPGRGAPDRDLTVPVFAGDRVVAVIGVANRATDYGPPQAVLLSGLALGLGRVLVRKRLHDSLQDPSAENPTPPRWENPPPPRPTGHRAG
jgi:GAF domain-containing protein